MAALDEAQADLFITLCEAARRQPAGSKESFLATRTGGGTTITHPTLPEPGVNGFHWPDLETLHRYGLLQGRLNSTYLIFDVSPAGFEHFDKLMAARGAPTERLEESVRRLLDSSSFASRFGDALGRLRKAEDLFWRDHSGEHATAIGHHCREAMQFFGVRFAEALGLTPAPPARTVDNVRAGIGALGALSPTRLSLLDALLTYWGSVVDVVQRQEHGASKEGDPLGHEDSRIAVFHTALVMFELASALASAGR